MSLWRNGHRVRRAPSLTVHFLAGEYFRHMAVSRAHPCGQHKSGSLSSGNPELVTCKHACGKLAASVIERRRAA